MTTELVNAWFPAFAIPHSRGHPLSVTERSPLVAANDNFRKSFTAGRFQGLAYGENDIRFRKEMLQNERPGRTMHPSKSREGGLIILKRGHESNDVRKSANLNELGKALARSLRSDAELMHREAFMSDRVRKP